MENPNGEIELHAICASYIDTYNRLNKCICMIESWYNGSFIPCLHISICYKTKELEIAFNKKLNILKSKYKSDISRKIKLYGRRGKFKQFVNYKYLIKNIDKNIIS